MIRRFERDVFPSLGDRPIDSITPPELLAVLRRMESRGAIETAHRIHQSWAVFRYAIGLGKYVFLGLRTPKRPMSNNAVLAALRRLGYAKDEWISQHGFHYFERTRLESRCD